MNKDEVPKKANLDYNHKINCYAVYDLKSDHYDIPFFSKNDLFAKRKFIIDVRNRSMNTMISHFKDDFELRLVGYYSLYTGEFDNSNKLIAKGTEVKTNEVSNETPIQ